MVGRLVVVVVVAVMIVYVCVNVVVVALLFIVMPLSDLQGLEARQGVGWTPRRGRGWSGRVDNLCKTTRSWISC